MVGTLLLLHTLPAALHYVRRKSPYLLGTLHKVLSEALVYEVWRAIYLRGWHPTATGWHPTATSWHPTASSLPACILLPLPEKPGTPVWQHTRPIKHDNGNLHHPGAQVVV